MSSPYKEIQTGAVISVGEYKELLKDAEKYQKNGSKGTKYNNVVSKEETLLFGVARFDSNAEKRRYFYHEKFVLRGVYKLERQVPFSIEVNGYKICDYVADFVLKYPDGKMIVEDVKGVKTAEYKLKMKLMKAVLDIEIIEIYETNRRASKAKTMEALAKTKKPKNLKKKPVQLAKATTTTLAEL